MTTFDMSNLRTYIVSHYNLDGETAIIVSQGEYCHAFYPVTEASLSRLTRWFETNPDNVDSYVRKNDFCVTSTVHVKGR